MSLALIENTSDQRSLLHHKSLLRLVSDQGE